MPKVIFEVSDDPLLYLEVRLIICCTYISGFRAWLKQMVKQNRSDESVKIQIGMWRRGCYKDDFITATAEHWWKRFSAARVLFLGLSLVTAHFVHTL